MLDILANPVAISSRIQSIIHDAAPDSLRYLLLRQFKAPVTRGAEPARDGGYPWRSPVRGAAHEGLACRRGAMMTRPSGPERPGSGEPRKTRHKAFGNDDRASSLRSPETGKLPPPDRAPEPRTDTVRPSRRIIRMGGQVRGAVRDETGHGGSRGMAAEGQRCGSRGACRSASETVRVDGRIGRRKDHLHAGDIRSGAEGHRRGRGNVPDPVRGQIGPGDLNEGQRVTRHPGHPFLQVSGRRPVPGVPVRGRRNWPERPTSPQGYNQSGLTWGSK